MNSKRGVKEIEKEAKRCFPKINRVTTLNSNGDGCFCLIEKSRFVLGGFCNRLIVGWDTKNEGNAWENNRHKRDIVDLVPLPHGYLSASGDGKAIIWDDDFSKVDSFRFDSGTLTCCIVFGRNWVIFGFRRKRLVKLKLKVENGKTYFDDDEDPRDIARTRQQVTTVKVISKNLIVIGELEAVSLFDARNEYYVNTLPIMDVVVYSICVLENKDKGQVLLAVSGSRSQAQVQQGNNIHVPILLLSMSPELLKLRVETVIESAHYNNVEGLVAFSNNRFFSGSTDKYIKMWSHGGENLMSLPALGECTVLLLLKNRQLAAGYFQGGKVRIFNTSRLEERSEFHRVLLYAQTQNRYGDVEIYCEIL